MEETSAGCQVSADMANGSADACKMKLLSLRGMCAHLVLDALGGASVQIQAGGCAGSCDGGLGCSCCAAVLVAAVR